MSRPSANPVYLAGARRPPLGESIVAAIDSRVHGDPDAPALEHRGLSVSYGELGCRASAVEQALVEAGVEPGAHVALWAKRTPAVIAGAYAAMRVGAAYVMIDPEYPTQRIEAITKLARPAAVLFDGEAGTPTLKWNCPTIDLAQIDPLRTPARRLAPRGDVAAYVVFTSGSTGTPKGVVVEHASLANYVSWCAAVVGEAGRGAPVFASLGFDHAATCVWVPLAAGKCVTVVAGLWEDRWLTGELPSRYTFLKLTPSHARFFERLLRPSYARATGVLMFGGEALDPSLVAQLADRLDGVRLLNHYGPTEATVGCCWHEFSAVEVAGLPSVPIGRPIWNSRAYVVDDDLQPVEHGQAGELVVAGMCVARGYLGAASDSFIDESEIIGGSDGRAYRTGDVVEQLDSGALLFLGRADSQLKINGYRIELDELRRCVIALPEVGEATFDVKAGDVEEVEAFVVPSACESDAAGIRHAVIEALGREVPAAVVPRRVHVVDQLLFDAHGKCDVEGTRRLIEERRS